MNQAQATLEALFYVNTASVETFNGKSGDGVDLFTAPTNVIGWADVSRKLVRDNNGDEVLAETTFYTSPTNAALFTQDSRVTINGNMGRVVRVDTNTSAAIGLPDHLAISIT